MGGSGTEKRRASRGTKGSGYGTTLAKKSTYIIHGQCYSRVTFMQSDGRNAIPGKGIIPLGLDNLFDRGAPFQMDLADYTVVPAELKLFDGKKELEKTTCDEVGRFVFQTDCAVGRKFRIQAVLENGERVFPERLTANFKVDKVPKGLKTHKVTVNTVNQVKDDFKQWKNVDREKLTAVVEGSTLWLTGKAALIFDTFALDVEYMSQHLSPNLKRDLSNLRYAPFKYDGKEYQIPLHHLCLATCTTISLRYYEVTLNGQAPRIEDICEAAARYVLDYHTGKTKRPDFAKNELNTDKLNDPARRVVEFANGEFPHNNMDFVLRGTEALLKKRLPAQEFLWGGGNDNVMKTSYPNVLCFMGLGWPFVIADDLRGTWDHGRVCTGVTVDHKGKDQRIYVIDPSRIERLTIKPDGKESDLGWCIFSKRLSQDEISPKRFWGGGGLPAPRRSPFY